MEFIHPVTGGLGILPAHLRAPITPTGPHWFHLAGNCREDKYSSCSFSFLPVHSNTQSEKEFTFDSVNLTIYRFFSVGNGRGNSPRASSYWFHSWRPTLPGCAAIFGHSVRRIDQWVRKRDGERSIHDTSASHRSRVSVRRRNASLLQTAWLLQYYRSQLTRFRLPAAPFP